MTQAIAPRYALDFDAARFGGTGWGDGRSSHDEVCVSSRCWWTAARTWSGAALRCSTGCGGCLNSTRRRRQNLRRWIWPGGPQSRYDNCVLITVHEAGFHYAGSGPGHASGCLRSV